MSARPIDEYPARSRQAAAIMLMINNNLDKAVAQHPHELITYGGNGAVFQNWAQYRLAMKYLSEMTDEQTLVMYSGHPMGLFPSHKDAPRVIVTNGMMIPNYSKQDDWERYNAMGVTQYGQMTAGSYMYIGPQGIVHGTTITVLNAARKQLQKRGGGEIPGMLFVSSGLGGMSGAQPKAGVISGVVSVIAEIRAHAPFAGLGRRGAHFAGRAHPPHPQGTRTEGGRIARLPGQHRRPVGTPRRGGHRRGPGLRPDLAPQPVGGRLLPRRAHLRRVEPDDGRTARRVP